MTLRRQIMGEGVRARQMLAAIDAHRGRKYLAANLNPLFFGSNLGCSLFVFVRQRSMRDESWIALDSFRTSDDGVR